jgi:hypothetical protein
MPPIYGAITLALMLGALWLLGTTEQAYACKCVVPGSPSEELEKFDAVFAGKVLSIEHSFDPDTPSRSPGDHTTVGFAVNTVWKGVVDKNIDLTTPPTGGSCGFAFVEEEEYIVYAYEGTEENANLNVSFCGRTAPLGEAQADLDALGEGYAPQAGTAGPSSQQPQDTGAGITRVIVVVIVAAVVVMVGGTGYTRARRR